MADNEIVQPPEDIATKTIVEKTASFVSKYESEIMLNDVRFNFLRSEADPCHAYYKYMLAKYSAEEAVVGSDTAVSVDPDDHKEDLTILDTGAEVRSITLAERVAYLVSIDGPVFEKNLRDSQANDPRFNFLRDSSDEYHEYYQRRLAYYAVENRSLRKFKPRSMDDTNTFCKHHILSLPNLLQFRLPQGMTLKELDTIKVTAQFSVWYGHYFVWALRNHMTQLEFLSPKHSWNAFYKECKQGFEKVLKPPKDSREKLYKSADYTGAVQQGFKQRIQQDDPVKERKWLEQGERAMIDWHDSVSKPFAIEEVQELPPQGPDAKRQKLDDWVLVPENQFLAQHPGAASLTVSFPNRQGFTLKVELSVSVLFLKQRIAQVIEIPAVKYKLSGKSGVLEDDKKSLAHYNVGPGDILTLSL